MPALTPVESKLTCKVTLLEKSVMTFPLTAPKISIVIEEYKELAVFAIPSRFPINPEDAVAVERKVLDRMSPRKSLSTRVFTEVVLLLRSTIFE